MIAAILSWFVVLTDCQGRPAWITHYELDWARRSIVDYIPCPDDPSFLCPLYHPFRPIRIGEVPQPPGAQEGDFVETPVPGCEPSPGGACYWITTAVDIYGRRSVPHCPVPLTPLEPGQIPDDSSTRYAWPMPIPEDVAGDRLEEGPLFCGGK